MHVPYSIIIIRVYVTVLASYLTKLFALMLCPLSLCVCLCVFTKLDLEEFTFVFTRFSIVIEIVC